MNNRLVVGGLALIIKPRETLENVGKVVKLLSFEGDVWGTGDCWEVYCEQGIMMPSRTVQDIATFEAFRLIPLGDEESKKQFEKEKGLENA